MTIEEAVAKLDALEKYDAESAHIAADDVLLLMVPPEVREAWERAQERIGFWYA